METVARMKLQKKFFSRHISFLLRPSGFLGHPLNAQLMKKVGGIFGLTATNFLNSKLNSQLK